MQEEWVHIPEFPGYMISNYGEVMKPDGHLLVKSPVQYNVPTVGLRLAGDNRTHRRAVPLLVAQAFLEDCPFDGEVAPIHLDGDRSNARADNLMWRPLWFAIKFHKEKRATKFPNWKARITSVEEGVTFNTIQEASSYYGLLEIAINACLMHPEDWAYPLGMHFVYTDV